MPRRTLPNTIHGILSFRNNGIWNPLVCPQVTHDDRADTRFYSQTPAKYKQTVLGTCHRQEKRGDSQSTIERSEGERGFTFFSWGFWRRPWSVEANLAPPWSLFPNTVATCLCFRKRQADQKFKFIFGCHILAWYLEVTPFVQSRETKSKQQMECVAYWQIVAEKNLITSLLKLHHYFPWQEHHRLKFWKGGRSGHNPTITVTANFAVMGRGAVLVPIH